jgi:hypothetical protein|tara:strand:+ start:665 stop:1309 length:645 start_codon:yes stop_codon:yes gene_type:complete
MYKSIWKTVGVLLFAVLLTNCSSTKYKIKQESDKIVTEVPQWYMANFDEKKHCDISMWANKPIVKSEDDDKVCIYGVGTSVSPSLELAIEKAKLIAKAEMADIVAGEMNKKAKIFVTEIGKTNQKTVVEDVETALVNVISNTPVRGYEIFAQEVTRTKKGYYRAWIGLRLPLGEFNKMYDYTIAEVVDSHKIKLKALEAFEDVESTSNEKKNDG